MLKLLLPILCLLSYGYPGLVQADASSQAAAERLAVTLKSVNYVSFYFLSRTGNYSFRADSFKAESTIKVYRECGKNCRMFMDEVISHLKQATLAECLPGQQNVLIEIGTSKTILYSHSGRMIELDGKCYFNKKGIDSTIKREEFLFN